jgi:hypothetical protein
MKERLSFIEEIGGGEMVTRFQSNAEVCNVLIAARIRSSLWGSDNNLGSVAN